MPGGSGEVNGTPTQTGDTWRLTLPMASVPGTVSYSWWAEDVNGKVSSVMDLELEVIDSEAPSIGTVDMFNATVGSVPIVEATISDVGGVASVTVTYVDVGGDPGSVAATEDFEDTWVARLPAQSKGGLFKYTVTAVDLVGNTAQSSERTMVIQDVSPPYILHPQPDEPDEGSDLTLEVQVTDDVGVASVVLYIRFSPLGSFRLMQMSDRGDGTFVVVIDGEQVEPPEIAYYFEAEDMPPSSNVVLDPVAGALDPYRLNVTALSLDLYGVVTDGSGDPITNARLGFKGLDNQISAGPDGSYAFTDLEPGVSYTLWVKARDYQDFELEVVLTRETGDRQLDIVLVPDTSDVDGGDGLSMTIVLALILIVVAVAVIGVALSKARRR
jgi:hypothetical protein